jgi:hypothetical protein
LKTSATRFHEHLAESLQRLDFNKTKHDPDLWMIDKSTHYEYLATYVDDILVWSKDPMAVIKSLEKIYVLKGVGIPEYYLGGNVEFLGETWKNHGLGLDLSTRTYIQNVILKFESLYGKKFKPVKTPLSEGYHPEIDDLPLCSEDDSAKYRSMIGCCVWIIVLGRFDIVYGVSYFVKLYCFKDAISSDVGILHLKCTIHPARSNGITNESLCVVCSK